MSRHKHMPHVDHHIVTLAATEESATLATEIIARLSFALGKTTPIPTTHLKPESIASDDDVFATVSSDHPEVLDPPPGRQQLVLVLRPRAPLRKKKRPRDKDDEGDALSKAHLSVVAVDSMDSALSAVINWAKTPIPGLAWATSAPTFVPLGISGGHFAVFPCISSANKDEILSAGTTHVVTLLDSANTKEVNRIKTVKSLIAGGPKWYHIDVGSNVPEIQEKAKAMALGVEWAHEAVKSGGVVLIHCIAGRHRSGTFAASLCASFGLSRQDTMLRLHATRPACLRDIGRGRMDLAYGCIQDLVTPH